MDQKKLIEIEILRALSDVAPNLMGEATVIAHLQITMEPAPMVSDMRAALSRLENGKDTLSLIHPDKGPQHKITMKGEGRLRSLNS